MRIWTDTQTELRQWSFADGHKRFCRTKMQGII